MKNPIQKPGILLALLFFVQFSGCRKPASLPEPAIDLSKGWRFKTGDRGVYKNPSLDDSEWAPIRVDQIWEAQGYDPYDGYAWYRVVVRIPSRLKEQSYLKERLRICLGKINNFDQCFLNGRIFGVNGRRVEPGTLPNDAFTREEPRLWDHERVYLLPVDDPRIRWDRDNLIAVRVFDEGGQGGIWSGRPQIRMENVKDYLLVDHRRRTYRFFTAGMEKKIDLRNLSESLTLSGVFTIRGTGKLTGEEVFRQTGELSLAPRSSREYRVIIPPRDQSCRVTYRFDFDQTPQTLIETEETPYVLTPPSPPEPRINCAPVTGARPRRPFLFTVATSGERPLTFSARRLPPYLKIDSKTGIITGTPVQSGRYRVRITARNRHGTDQKRISIVIGDRISLTPPMGTNSWNCWGLSVSQEKILQTARALVETGLVRYGWSYINIDDGWSVPADSEAPGRDRNGRILPNGKFPDMQKLAAEIHRLGLKLGIYTSPGPVTCGGYTGSYGHEAQDARTFASWGVDFLKYDWCSYEEVAEDHTVDQLKKPFVLMGEILAELKRDVVFSICQYGMGQVWEWGAEAGGNLWRTTGDITDTWESMSNIGFGQADSASYAGPGHWNDPDMLVVGWVGWGPRLHPTRLTPDEQYTHISLWSLMAAPLLIGCDLERMDRFTLNLLTNREVLAVNQDPAGKQGYPVIKEEGIQVWKKPLADENQAVGIFNLDPVNRDYTLDLQELDVFRPVRLRDLWRQRDLGVFDDLLKVKLPAHGVILLKMSGLN